MTKNKEQRKTLCLFKFIENYTLKQNFLFKIKINLIY